MKLFWEAFWRFFSSFYFMVDKLEHEKKNIPCKWDVPKIFVELSYKEGLCVNLMRKKGIERYKKKIKNLYLFNFCHFNYFAIWNVYLAKSWVSSLVTGTKPWTKILMEMSGFILTKIWRSFVMCGLTLKSSL